MAAESISAAVAAPSERRPRGRITTATPPVVSILTGAQVVSGSIPGS